MGRSGSSQRLRRNGPASDKHQNKPDGKQRRKAQWARFAAAKLPLDRCRKDCATIHPLSSTCSGSNRLLKNFSRPARISPTTGSFGAPRKAPTPLADADRHPPGGGMLLLTRGRKAPSNSAKSSAASLLRPPLIHRLPPTRAMFAPTLRLDGCLPARINTTLLPASKCCHSHAELLPSYADPFALPHHRCPLLPP